MKTQKESCFRIHQGGSPSDCTPAASSRELCKTFWGWFCQVTFREPFLFSSSRSSLSPSPSRALSKAAIRSWKPLVLQSNLRRGCSRPWWLMFYSAFLNLHTQAKSFYLFPAHTSPLVPWKLATCCQLSQGSRVLKANQEKADWIQKQNWFIAHRFETWSCQHSNMPQE